MICTNNLLDWKVQWVLQLAKHQQNHPAVKSSRSHAQKRWWSTWSGSDIPLSLDDNTYDTLAVCNWNFLLFSFSPKNSNTVSSYVVKIGTEAKALVKVQLFRPKKSILIIRFLAIFRLTWDTNNIFEAKAFCVPQQCVIETLVSSRICSTVALFQRSSIIVYNFVRIKKLWTQKLVRHYSEMENYFFTNYATVQAIAKNEASVLPYSQPQNNIF